MDALSYETIKVCSVCGFRTFSEDGLPDCLGHRNMIQGLVYEVERSRAGYRRPALVKSNAANFPFVGKPFDWRGDRR